jgi:hypothetical protein
VSLRTYYMDDATIAVPPGFVDRSVNVLEWPLEGGGKIMLVVQRERLPGSAGGDLPQGALSRYASAQTKDYPAQFAGFSLERDEVTSDGSGLEMRRMAFRWRREQEVLYHQQVFILAGADVLLVTASSNAEHREAVDRLTEDVITALRIRAEDYRR